MLKNQYDADKIKWLHLGRKQKYFVLELPDPERLKTRTYQVTVILSRGRKHTDLVALFHEPSGCMPCKLSGCQGMTFAKALNKLLRERTGKVWITKTFRKIPKPRDLVQGVVKDTAPAKRVAKTREGERFVLPPSKSFAEI